MGFCLGVWGTCRRPKLGVYGSRAEGWRCVGGPDAAGHSTKGCCDDAASSFPCSPDHHCCRARRISGWGAGLVANPRRPRRPAGSRPQCERRATRSEVAEDGGVLPHQRAAGHDHRPLQRALPLCRAAGRPGIALRHRRRPRRLPVAGPRQDHAQAGMAGLDAAAGDDRSASPICRASWPAAPAIRWARARSISAPRSTASTAPTSRTPSASAVSSGCFRLTNPDVYRSLRARSGRDQGDHPAAAGSLIAAPGERLHGILRT